ncbi:hypothetical protein [Ancylobacter pratisalsi]|uniref:Porin family protein n=1 Tax=Ancylobacter pratisalsi TaxID=1745854 RepID=A0A6P1YRC3_9HYPH|nr:hypothetical protein [Ancylobacter pratisalsi]QIB34603.1 hypothetical protein G3A50_13410 [Ancylobacter pratisalsi]
MHHIRLACLMAVALCATAAWRTPAHAADIVKAPPAPTTVAPLTSDWQFQATFYGWATAMNGDVGVRGLPPASVDLSAYDALTNLDGALMGAFSGKKGDWSFLFDVVYASLSDGVTFGPLGGSRASLGVKQTIFSGLVGYRMPLGLPDNVDLSATVGFRYQHLSGDFNFTNAYVPLAVSTKGTQDWIDPTIGLQLNYAIDEKWFINAIADVGGFGVGSKITAQGFATLGYMWTPSISTAIGYRAIYTDYENDGFVYNVTQHGAFLSLGYHF